MTVQTRYYSISAGMHGLLLMLGILLTAGVAVRKEVVTIDFNLENNQLQCAPQLTKQSSRAPPLMSSVQREPVAQAVIPTTEPVPVTPDKPLQEQTQYSVAVGAPAPAVTHNTETAASTGKLSAPVSAAHSVSATPNSNRLDKETIAEQGRTKYLKEHFSYIRDLIMKRLVYPPVARRMEWSGKVVVAFVVAEDGRVNSVRVRDSSGYPVLDNSAMETVKVAAPFPPPPAAAEILIPVSFKLQ